MATRKTPNTATKQARRAARPAAFHLEARSGELLTIPLSRLVPSPQRNVRRQGGEDVASLKASVRALGLLENLIVCPHLDAKGQDTGDYEVVGGGRRLRVLRELAREGEIGRDELVLCRVKHTREAAEASLAENVQREPMHPADEFEAFKGLVDEGMPIEDVAARFGLSPLTVKRRLKLAALSPKLLAEYRAGGINLEQMMALALTDDHAQQERVWAEAPHWHRDAESLRHFLTDGHIDSGSALARFVTVEAYEAAGGVVVRDLFDDANGGTLADAALLQRLALQKLEQHLPVLRAEGWSWVEARTVFAHSEQRGFGRALKGHREPTKREQSRLNQLEREFAKAQAVLAGVEDGEGDPDEEELRRLDARCDELEAELAALRNELVTWAPEVMASAGAVVTLDASRGVLVHRGLVRPEDRQRAARAAQAKDGGSEGGREDERANGDGGSGAAARPTLSESLARQLTAHRTAALQWSLAQQPQVALAALLHPMMARLMDEHGMPVSTPVKVSASGCAYELTSAAADLADAPAWTALQGLVARWTERIPGDAEQVLPWLLEQPQQTLIDLLALCTALAVNAVDGRPEQNGNRGGARGFDVLARATALDMAQWWQPSVAGYLGRVSKAVIVEAVAEGVSKEAAAPLSALKKGEAAARAEQMLAGKGWVPRVLRAAPVGPEGYVEAMMG